MNKKKLLLIGWDAADWHIIEPLIADGKMPALQRLLKGGVKGNIATLNPVLSPMLWTSIATGKRAYDHGIHGFVEVDKVTGEIFPVRGSSRKVKAFWNILNEAGLKTNVINWWPSHPAEKLNGVSVSNHLHKDAPVYGEEWAMDEAAVHPPEQYEKLKNLRLHPAELTLQHVLPFIPAAATLDPEKDKVLKPLMRVLAHGSSVHNAATYLMENTEWDCMAVYYEAIDHFSHLAMKYHPPQLKGIVEDEFELYHQVVESAYRFHDMMLERMLDLAGEDCTVMLISDHGFESGELRHVELPDIPAAPALEHRKYGVFAAAGPGLKCGEQVYGASLLDIAPTILHHFELPIGEDMEGQVLRDIYYSSVEVGHIPSWEMTETKSQFVEGYFGHEEGMLNELEQLGYIDLSQDDKLAYVQTELNYNLCTSYLDGNRPKEARILATKGFEDSGQYRFALLLAQALHQLGSVEELKSHLAQLPADFCTQPAIQYFDGLLKLQEGQVPQALQVFENMEEQGVVSANLFLEMARTLFASGEVMQAENYYRKVLELDPNHAAALTGLAQCEMEQGGVAKALISLEKSLELQFFQPNAHYLMAIAAAKMGHSKVAAKALELCLKQAPHHQKGVALKEKIKGVKEVDNSPITIVSGFPRSGTSMLMRMLSQAGLTLYQSERREGDEHNPLGYYEHEKVKKLGAESDWIPEARGKVLKVVSPLLRYLPPTERYKILVMKRPLTEVVVSQQVMMGKNRAGVMRNFPFQAAANMQQEEKRLENWLKMQPHIEFTEIQYYDCMEEPEMVLETIQEFLKTPLNLTEGAKAVDKNLHRNKLGK